MASHPFQKWLQCSEEVVGGHSLRVAIEHAGTRSAVLDDLRERRREVETGFDLGAQLSAGYLHPERFAGSFSALLRWRLETLRIDVTPSVELFAGATNIVDLRVPVDLWWQLSDDFTLGLRTGIIAPGFTDARLGIIVGARAVYSLGRGDTPFMDLFVSFDAEPLIHFSGTIFRDDFVIVQLGAQAHFGP